MYFSEKVPFNTLLGKTLTKVTGKVGGSDITFFVDDGSQYRLDHEQSCCESVTVNDIVGDLEDLVGSPILMAEEATNDREHPDDFKPPDWTMQSFTWTFYKLATIKGYVTLRWLGESSGYYSEAVEFFQMETAKPPAPEPEEKPTTRVIRTRRKE